MSAWGIRVDRDISGGETYLEIPADHQKVDVGQIPPFLCTLDLESCVYRVELAMALETKLAEIIPMGEAC